MLRAVLTRGPRLLPHVRDTRRALSLPAFAPDANNNIETMPLHEETQLALQMVKKVRVGGEMCLKCEDTFLRMAQDEVFPYVGSIVYYNETDATSLGTRLAERYGVERAPFFLTRDADGTIHTWTSYFRLRRVLFEQLGKTS